MQRRSGGAVPEPKAETKGPSAKAKKEEGRALPAAKSAANGSPTVGRGAVAQMGERCNRTAEVRGSIPLSSTSPGSAIRGIAEHGARDLSERPIRLRASKIPLFGQCRLNRGRLGPATGLSRLQFRVPVFRKTMPDHEGRRAAILRSEAKSCRHMVRNSSQNPVTASQLIAKPTMMISGWLKLVRFA